MTSSNDTYAQRAVGYVKLVNQIGSYFNYFQPPTGATRSSQPITVANGRIEATQKQYLTYTWTDQQTTIAYQISEEGDKYVWEIFLKQGEGDFQRFIYAEESKVARIGKMDVYNYFAGQGNDLLMKYAWEEKEDESFILTGIVPSGDLTYVITVNPDASGSAKYTFAQDKYEIQWDAAGNGNWAFYSEGSVVTSGDWSV
ncbi:hypothetical protein [Tunicatimonas pelagia]|uniref:hypothetical protein n=1 Tax=Tunicatimonas pelagia TaxID=931531 RepID=UPI002664E482|nr:hypothetical protein [Tunicatimonas pelagia]WKN43333.1 hypothetical protein P0M28_30275 [Tunicatimonas pelagia]